MTRQEYYATVQAVEETAEKQFTESEEGKKLYAKGCNSREWRNAVNHAQKEAIDRWAAEQPAYFSIIVERNQSSTEISDKYLGSSITVYHPRREYDWGADDQRKPVIVPAYINSSTWDTRGDIQHCQWRTRNYLKMVEMAFELQNEMNQLLVEWQTMENPFSMARYEKNELERLRADAKAAHEEANRKAEERKTRRANK